MLRYLAADNPGPLRYRWTTLCSRQGRVTLRAEVRDKEFRPRGDALVAAHVNGRTARRRKWRCRPQPGSRASTARNGTQPPKGRTLWRWRRGGRTRRSGASVAVFRRENGVADSFHMTGVPRALERLRRRPGAR